MTEVVYLRKGERRPRGKSTLIECKLGLRSEEIVQTSSGAVTLRINCKDLASTLAALKQKGVTKIYVRKSQKL